jgi:hypothetical protein
MRVLPRAPLRSPFASMLSHYVQRCLETQRRRNAQRKERQARLLMLPVEDYEALPERQAELQNGRQRVLAFEACRKRMLEELEAQRGMRLSYDQKRLLDAMRNTLLLRMYDGDINALEADRHWLRNTLQVMELYQTALITYPRRSGKTLTETLCMGIVMLSQRDGNGVCINPKKHHAKAWLTQCKEHLDLLRNDDTWGFEELEHRSGEIFKLRQNYTGGEIVEVVCQGNASQEQHVSSLRGSGKRTMLLCCDEAYFFCDAAWPVILPLAANGCALVMTSSMAHKHATLFQIRDARFRDGCPVVQLLDYRAACSECTLKEEQTGLEVKCDHVVHPPTHFRTIADMERTQALMNPFGSFDREILNIPPSASAERIFKPEWIEACLGIGAFRVSKLPTVKRIYVAVDPGALGKGSDTVVMIFCYVNAAEGIPALPKELDPIDQHLIVCRPPSTVAPSRPRRVAGRPTAARATR